MIALSRKAAFATKGQADQKRKEQRLRPGVQSQLEPFLRRVAEASEAALLLDYDGTLAPFRAQRDQAYPYPGVTSLLQEILGEGRTRVVVISGRDASDVLPFLKLDPSPEVWGIHGLQRLRPDGTTEMPELDERTVDGLSDAGRWLGYQELLHTAEFKAGSIAVHWRGLSDNNVEALRSRVLLGWRSIAKQRCLNLLEFDGGVEIRASQANKGDAVRSFWRVSAATRRLPILATTTPTNPLFKRCGAEVSVRWCAPSGGKLRLNSGSSRRTNFSISSACG